jgi:hypothetical protein
VDYVRWVPSHRHFRAIRLAWKTENSLNTILAAFLFTQQALSLYIYISSKADCVHITTRFRGKGVSNILIITPPPVENEKRRQWLAEVI